MPVEVDRNLKDLNFFSQYTSNCFSFKSLAHCRAVPSVRQTEALASVEISCFFFVFVCLTVCFLRKIYVLSRLQRACTVHTNLGGKKSSLWLNWWVVAQILPKASIFPWHYPCSWHGNNVGGCPATLWPAMSCMRAYCCRDKKTQVYPRHIVIENYNN